MSQNNDSIHFPVVGKVGELILDPIEVLILQLLPLFLVLDLASPEGMDADKEHAIRGDGKILLTHGLDTKIKRNTPMLMKAVKGVGPVLKTLLPVDAIVVAIVSGKDKHWNFGALKHLGEISVRTWAALRGSVVRINNM